MNNISAVRYILAFSVIIAHLGELMNFEVYWPIPSYIGVGGFFALSGYLIFASYDRRPRLIDFLRRRAQRIMPPYVFIVLMCAIGLVTVSTLSPWDYFTSPGWWRYLLANLTFLNFLEPSLPGVFNGYAEPAVNGSLWTMKIEWMLYLSVPVVAWLGKKWKCNRTSMTIAIFLFSVAYRLMFMWLYQRTGSEFCLILSRQLFGQLAFFYTGVWVYAQQDFFNIYRHRIAVVCVILCLLSSHIPFYSQVFEPAVVSLLVIYACTTGHWGTWVPVRRNVSYEMYLCHFPIIQLLTHFGFAGFGFWPCLLMAVSISALVGVCMSRLNC